MTLKDKLQEDIKQAMRDKQALHLQTLRLILSALKQKEIDERITLDDPQIYAILEKMLKQRHDSITHYQKGNRPDLVEKEASEIAIIQAYLPEPLSEKDIKNLIQKAVLESHAQTIQDMGKIMAILKPTLQGRANMTHVSQWIKEALGA